MKLEVIHECITDPDLLIQGYRIHDGFVFQAIRYPANVFDAILIRNPPSACGFGDAMSASARSLDDHIEFINQYGIDKAIVIAEDISFLNKCPSIKHLNVVPSIGCGDNFDFSPLYKHPAIRSLYCRTIYGKYDENELKIDYSRISGLEDLTVHTVSNQEYRRIPTLKKLSISQYCGSDLKELFCSKDLDTLEMNSCKIRNLDGIEAALKLQCVYLTHNRQLEDISSLRKVRQTIRALRISKCPKIKDFSVLSDLENLDYLFLEGGNSIPSLNFLNLLPNLKTLICCMEISDGDLTPCMRLSYVHCGRIRKHYNLRAHDLPKGIYYRGNENIEPWRRVQ